MNELTSIEQLEELLNSAEGPILILKHSTTCPISAGAYRRVQDYLNRAGASASPVIWLVRVHESRAVSNAIADRLGVPHKSPQLLLVRDGKCVWNASHYDIGAESIEKALKERAA